MIRQRYVSAICLFLVLTFPLGCANDYQELEAHFYQGRYLEAGKSAVSGAKNKKLNSKVMAYIKEFGPKYLSKSTYQAKVMSKRYQEEVSITFLQELLTIYEQMVLLDFPIDGLAIAIEEIENLLTETIVLFVNHHLEIGRIHYEQKNYKNALPHFYNVLNYEPNNTKALLLKKNALKQVHKHVLITPIYTPLDPKQKIVSNRIAALLNQEYTTDLHEDTVMIQGVNLSNRFNHRLASYLQDHQDAYLTLYFESKMSDNSLYTFQVEGLVDGEEVDNSLAPQRHTKHGILRYQYMNDNIKQWDQAPFTFDVYTVSYTVRIVVDVTIKSLKSNQKSTRITFEESATRSTSYKAGDPVWLKPFDVVDVQYPVNYQRYGEVQFPIDKPEILYEAVSKASKRLSKSILTFLAQQ